MPNRLANQQIRTVVLCLTLLCPTATLAGAYISAGSNFGVDSITHPQGYTGTGGLLTVTLCIDPATPNAADMVIPLQNVANTWNRLQATTGNLLFGASNDIPAGAVDIESAMLHEVGHCIGLHHVNLASESGQSGNNRNYTKTTAGGDGLFDLDAGTDGVIGSSDDLRDDDSNMHWFKIADNNPFTLPATIDASTYSIDLADLPPGDTFATNGDRTVSTLFGVANTEATMQQGQGSDEDQRALTADGVATIRLAASGLDEIQGTADDYTLNMQYVGLTTSCDMVARLDSGGLASCSTSTTSLTGRHRRLVSASIHFGPGINWYFNQVSNASEEVFEDGFE